MRNGNGTKSLPCQDKQASPTWFLHLEKRDKHPWQLRSWLWGPWSLPSQHSRVSWTEVSLKQRMCISRSRPSWRKELQRLIKCLFFFFLVTKAFGSRPRSSGVRRNPFTNHQSKVLFQESWNSAAEPDLVSGPLGLYQESVSLSPTPPCRNQMFSSGD